MKPIFSAFLIVVVGLVADLPGATPLLVANSYAFSSVSAQQSRVRRQQTQLPVVQELDTEGLRTLLSPGRRRERPLLINFWATWCEPCREEFPDIIRVSRHYNPSKLEFITVSLDDVAEIKTGVPKFLKQMGAQMAPYLLNVTEPEEAIKIISDTWSGELPATFLVDREGRVVFEHKGRITFADLSAALKTLIK